MAELGYAEVREMWDRISYLVKEATVATEALRIPIPQSLASQSADIYTFSAKISEVEAARAENPSLDWFAPNPEEQS